MTQFPNLESLSSHVPSPHIPPRTLLDAERDIAELRLAMVGMGKTMGNWLDTLEEVQGKMTDTRCEAAQQGLRRLQRTLIDGATTTTADLKEWAWSQELATTPSVSSASSPIDPLESGDLQLSFVQPAASITEQIPQDRQSADSLNASSGETFVLESPPDKKSSEQTPTLRASGSPSSHRRPGRILSPSTQEPSAESPKDFGLAGRAHAYGGTSYAIQQQQAQPLPADQFVSTRSVPETTDPTGTTAVPEVELDPLSGLAVNNESRASAFGMKRLSKDPPLRGLGFL